MIQAYKDYYVSYISETIATMYEDAISNGYDYKVFWCKFISSSVAREIERGNVKYLNYTNIDCLMEIIDDYASYYNIDTPVIKNKYYWAGWALTQYQHKSGYSFYRINTYFPIEKVLQLYDTLHETDITKFFDIADSYMNLETRTNLKRIRNSLGISQSELANKAQVDIRSIQMYEQRNNDINKASAITLYKLSRALGCNIEDLLEK